MNKDPRLLAVLDYMRQRLGASSFEIEDHWEADLLATGIRSRTNPNVLAYVALSGNDRFTVTIEVDARQGSDIPFTELGTFECGNPEDVCWVILDFLAIDLQTDT